MFLSDRGFDGIGVVDTEAVDDDLVNLGVHESVGVDVIGLVARFMDRSERGIDRSADCAEYLLASFCILF